MKIPRPIPRSTSGAVMLMVLMFVFASTIAITAWMYLSAARLQQSERLGTAVQRHVTWTNSSAISQQYAFTFAYRDNVTRSASAATLASGWGGGTGDAYSALTTFNTAQRTTGGTYGFPFKNLPKLPTSDSGVYFTRTALDSDTSSAERLYCYNYHKTYPRTLLGDLLVIHTRPSAATVGAYFTDNMRVDGRVVILDSSADTIGLRATTCLNVTASGTNTTLTSLGTSSLLPDNYPKRPMTHAGYGGAGAPYAITDGSLNMLNNTNFPANSLWGIMQALGPSAYVTYSTNNDAGTNDTPVKVGGDKMEIKLLNGALTHLRIAAQFDEIKFIGTDHADEYATMDTLTPVIVWIDHGSVNKIKFDKENNRRLIFAFGQGPGLAVEIENSGGGSGPAGNRWRMHLINEYRDLTFKPPGAGVIFTGSIRTNWHIRCTAGDNNVRYILQRETNPGGLETLLPRDGWLETLYYIH